MADQDRSISLLRLFTLDRPVWTVEAAADALQVSPSSAYRYFAVLMDAGLLTTVSNGQYVLGPAIIQFDRQIQLTDPLLQWAKPVMGRIAAFAPAGSAVLLCRLFQDTVLCIHQVADPATQNAVSYERGRPMPLFRGATSKIMLAHLSWRELRRLYDGHRTEIGVAGLGETWEAFRTERAKLRKAGHVVSHAEVDPDRIGVAAPILDPAKRLLGSLSYVVPATEAGLVVHLVALIRSGAREIEAGLAATLAVAA